MNRIYEFCDPSMESSTQGLRPWTAIWAPEEQARSWKWKKFSSKEEAMSTTAVINYSSGYVTVFPLSERSRRDIRLIHSSAPLGCQKVSRFPTAIWSQIHGRSSLSAAWWGTPQQARRGKSG